MEREFPNRGSVVEKYKLLRIASVPRRKGDIGKFSDMAVVRLVRAFQRGESLTEVENGCPS